MGNSNVGARKIFDATNPKDKQDEEEEAMGAQVDSNFALLPKQNFLVLSLNFNTLSYSIFSVLVCKAIYLQ